MTVNESKGLKKGNRVCWRGDAADGGTISGTSWDAVTIAWDNGQVAPYTMEIFAKSTQRRQSQRRVSVLQQCTIPVEIIFGGGSV
jgi:hypothetical protein